MMTLPMNADGCTPSPFEDALVVWDMVGTQGPARNAGRLSCRGQVVLGALLHGADLDASMRRGGSLRTREGSEPQRLQRGRKGAGRG